MIFYKFLRRLSYAFVVPVVLGYGTAYYYFPDLRSN